MHYLVALFALLFGAPAEFVLGESCSLISAEKLTAEADVRSLDSESLKLFWDQTDNREMLELTQARIEASRLASAAEAMCDLL